MKKLVAVVFAILMAIVMSTAAFAEGVIPNEIVHVGDLPTTSEKEVTIEISGDDTLPVEYHVAVTWMASDGSYVLGEGGIAWDCDKLCYVLNDEEGVWIAPTCSVKVVNASTPGQDITVTPSIDGANAWVDDNNESFVTAIVVGSDDILTGTASATTVNAVDSATDEAQGSGGIETGGSNVEEFEFEFTFDKDLIAAQAFRLALAKADALELTNTFVITINAAD